MLSLFKVEIHHLYHSKTLGLMEIGHEYGVTAREALEIVEEVDKKKAEYKERQKSRWAIKRRIGGRWLCVNKKLKAKNTNQRSHTASTEWKQPKKKQFKGDKNQALHTAMALAMKEAGISYE